MSDHPLRAGERRKAADGDLLALSPLPVASGARPSDPADWIRRKNPVWMDLQGGSLVFASELSLMFLSLCILLCLAMVYVTIAFYLHNDRFVWEPTIAAVVGSLFFTAPFGIVIHYNTNKAIKEGPPIRLNRQKREVAMPCWVGGKEVKIPFWGRDASVGIYTIYLFTSFGVMAPFLHEGPLDEFQRSFVYWSLGALFLESLVFIPYILIGLHLHKKHKPRLEYVYHPWEQLVAYVQKQQDMGPSIFTERTMLTLAVPDPDHAETAKAAASVAVGHETVGLAQWESIRWFMEDGPEACPDPRDYGTLAHYKASCRQARREKPMGAWLWKKVGDWFFQRYLAHKLTEWRVNNLIPRSLPVELHEWSQPLPEDQWARPSEALQAGNRRMESLRKKNPGLTPQALLEAFYRESREGEALPA
ncbi:MULTISPECIES: hypothetical protein [unclassified Marinobacter]|uniref:hypothetical protein n=1 Tax=unclassified Marinobacter TaxID=83889 RepID=UPI001927E395|nr:MULTISPECIES: hypothetical protein [unclassified Marinobacter]MBL3825662.1 hypothetical protein [Marinobacter sp. MC3]MBL3894024.1 hypothetical protein [Marinobacter sp. MW3]